MQVDFIKIINIHVALKNHLTDLIAKKTIRLLDPVKIEQDYLGKLIYSNEQHLAALPAFKEIQQLHMSFHGIYYEILRLYQAEQHVKAAQLLEGRFEVVFRALKSRIILLSQQYNAQFRNPMLTSKPDRSKVYKNMQGEQSDLTGMSAQHSATSPTTTIHKPINSRNVASASNVNGNLSITIRS